ncbi:hypothetical protein HUJ04_001278 [Dendroctonus ponderosae]|nr:hypothetical protein HUJ04_001278 [Dendroctonus ponderosae]
MRRIGVRSDAPQKHHIELLHYRQKSNWDCGVSCVLMVLPNKHRQHLTKNLSKICKSEGFNKSTWTIDLCYLLKKYEVQHVFYTVTIGVHEGYRGNSFYHQILTKDENRVKVKFRDASKNKIPVRKASISILHIIEQLLNGPIIILTNARLLYCDICKSNKISNELRKCLPWPTTYQGHYIVLCGYDIERQRVFYRNPSFGDHVCAMSVSTLEEARKSYGTDEDKQRFNLTWPKKILLLELPILMMTHDQASLSITRRPVASFTRTSAVITFRGINNRKPPMAFNNFLDFFQKGKTFRPKKQFAHGTIRYSLHKQAQASLNSGINLRAAVKLPPGEDLNDWIAVHGESTGNFKAQGKLTRLLVVDFFNRINLIYGTICDDCTEQTCPTMSGGPRFEYLWADGGKFKKPTPLPAREYISYLMDWIEMQINNQAVFPCTSDMPFPKNFATQCCKILARLHRVFVHVYIHHFQNVVAISAEAHVNTCYKHFYYFVTEHNLVSRKELEPLKEMASKICKDPPA